MASRTSWAAAGMTTLVCGDNLAEEIVKLVREPPAGPLTKTATCANARTKGAVPDQTQQLRSASDRPAADQI